MCLRANIGWYVVSEKWHHFWELTYTNLLGLFKVAGKNNIFPILSNIDISCIGSANNDFKKDLHGFGFAFCTCALRGW